MTKFLSISLFALFLSLSAQAACLKEGQNVELEGVLTTKAIYIAPSEFGWVPENGFVEYTVLVVNKPFCFETSEEKFQGEHMIQIGYNSPSFSAAELHKGVAVKVSGELFSSHTAHHFQNALISPAKVTKR